MPSYESNIKQFILFRLFYNARFYYPIITVLYLDYGLTLEQFAILNMVWSLTIVLAEVPSGALADLLGRRRLVVFAACLTVIEMTLLAFAPMGDSPYLFLIFFINRLCSGLSQAASSGADEALAYDSLKALGREQEWPTILARVTKLSSVMFFIVMIMGGLVYDPAVVNGLLGVINPAWSLSREWIIRLPVLLTLGSAILTLMTAFRFVEVHDSAEQVEALKSQAPATPQSWRHLLSQPFQKVGSVAEWIFKHPMVLCVILGAMILDSVARQFVLLSSEYWRVIGIPVAWFGFIGAGMAVLGFVNARLSTHLLKHYRPATNFAIMAVGLLVGLVLVCFAFPYVSVLFAATAFLTIGMVQFQSSYYINRLADSKQRATVLSFKGLALNLGLAMSNLIYTGYIAWARTLQDGQLSAEEVEALAFIDSLTLFPLYLVVLYLLLAIYVGRLIRKKLLCFDDMCERLSQAGEYKLVS